MKKQKSVAALFLFSVLLLCAFSAAADDNKTVEIKVIKAVGEAEYAAEDGVWKPLGMDAKLKSGYEVRTGGDGEVVLVWLSGNVLKLSPLLKVTIENVSKDGKGNENTSLRLNKGHIHAKAKKLINAESSFTIRTPVAIAGVRGTEFTAEHAAGGEKSKFMVIDGSISVEALGIATVLDAAFMLEVDAGMPPGEILPIPDDIMEQLGEESEELQQAEAAVPEAEPGAEAKAEAEAEPEAEAGPAPAPEPGPVPEGQETAPVDATGNIADFVSDEIIEQNIDDLLFEHVITPADDCCNY